METTTQTTTTKVDSDKVFEVEKFLKKMKKKGDKLGQIFKWEFSSESYHVQAKQYIPVLTWCGSQSWEVREVTRTVRDLTMEGTLPKLSGWEIVGILKYEGDKPTVHAQTSKIPKRFLGQDKGSISCDGCNKKRHRKTIFILKKGARTYRAIGSTCVKDFTGWDGDLNAITRWASALKGLFGEGEPEFEGMKGGGSYQGYDLQQFCTLAAYEIRVRGYASWRMVEEHKAPHTTGSEVANGMIEGSARNWPHTAADSKLAARAIRAARKLSEEARSNDGLLQNLWAVASGDVVQPKRAGLAAWLVEWHRREKAKRAATARKARGGRWCGVSDHVGAIGNRTDWMVKVVGRYVMSGFYGDTVIFKMVTESGNMLVWFCSGDSQGLKEGGIFTLKGTVKRHGDFKDEKQTTINRCKVITA